MRYKRVTNKKYSSIMYLISRKSKQVTRTHKQQQGRHRGKWTKRARNCNDRYFTILPELALQWETFPRQ